MRHILDNLNHLKDKSAARRVGDTDNLARLQFELPGVDMKRAPVNDKRESFQSRPVDRNLFDGQRVVGNGNKIQSSRHVRSADIRQITVEPQAADS